MNSRIAVTEEPKTLAFMLVTALVTVTFGEGVLLAVVPTAVAGVGRLFRVAPGRLNWVSTVQLVSLAVCTPVFAQLGNRWGYARLLRIAAATSAVGAGLAALSPTFAVFLLGRALQGPVGAFTPLAVGVIRSHHGGR